MYRFEKADLSLLVREPRLDFDELRRLSRLVKFRPGDQQPYSAIRPLGEHTTIDDRKFRLDDYYDDDDLDDGELPGEQQQRDGDTRTSKLDSEDNYWIDRDSHIRLLDFNFKDILHNAQIESKSGIAGENNGYEGQIDNDNSPYFARMKLSDHHTLFRANTKPVSFDLTKGASSQDPQAAQEAWTDVPPAGGSNPETVLQALQVLGIRQGGSHNQITLNEMFVTYTISEDRTEDYDGVDQKRLAALNDELKRFNISGDESEKDVLQSRFWSPDPLLHHLDEPYRQRILMYMKEDTTGLFQCLVPNCSLLLKLKSEWADHVEEAHDGWIDALREEFGLSPLPIDETSLDPRDVEEVLSSTLLTRRQAARFLQLNNNDVDLVIAAFARGPEYFGESAMEEVD